MRTLEDVIAKMQSDHAEGSLAPLATYQALIPQEADAVATVHEYMALGTADPAENLEPASRSIIGLEALADEDRVRHTVGKELGRGGMGVVYEARDEILRRDLAVKTVLTPASDGVSTSSGSLGRIDEMPLHVRRLLEEAQITAQLDHSGVVPVHELGIDAEGRAFFSMKRVRGRTLEEIFELVRARATQWSLSRALQVFLKICDTLSYAHSKHVVHRDLKPANVMVGRYGEVYVMDWGLAKVQGTADDATPERRVPTSVVITDQAELANLQERASLTNQGDVIGTLGYISPEQAFGAHDKLEPRSDVWSIGAMLYELLAGHPPYREPATNMRPVDILIAYKKGPPAPLLSRNPDAAPELVAIAERAMAPEPADRFPTVKALADEIHAYLEGRVVRSYQTGLWIELRKWVGRNKLAAAGIVAAVLLIAGATTAFVLQQRDAAREQRNAARAIAKQRDVAIAARRRAEGLRLSTLANLQLEKDPAVALNLAIEGARRAPGPAADNALYAAIEANRLHAALIGHEGYIHSVAFTRDGSTLVTAGGAGHVVIWDVEAKEARHWLDAPNGDVVDFAMMPDERHLVVLHADGVARSWSMDAGEEVASWQASAGKPTSLARLGPDKVVTSDESGSVVLWHATTAKRLHTLASYDSPAVLVTAARNHDQVLAVTADGRASLFQAGRSKPAWSLGPDTLEASGRRQQHGFQAALDPLGRHVALAWPQDASASPGGKHVKGHAEIRSARDGSVLCTVESEYDGFAHVRYAADGTRVVLVEAGREGTTGCPIHVVRTADFSETVRRSPLDKPVLRAVSPDGSRLILAQSPRAYDATVFDTDSQEPELDLRGHKYDLTAATFSEDGVLVATVSQDRVVRIWMLRAPEERVGIERLQRRGWLPKVWSPDGGRCIVLPPKDSLERTRIVDTRDGRTLGELPFASAEVQGHAFARSPGRVLVVRGHENLLTYDYGSNQLIKSVRMHREAGEGDAQIHLDALSPDGSRIVVGTKGKALRIHDVATGGVLTTLDLLHIRVKSPRWSPDSTRLLVSHVDYAVATLYDTATGRQLVTLRGHRGFLLSCDYHPDGTRVVTSAKDTSVRVWDAETGDQLQILTPLPMHKLLVQYSADGSTICVRGRPRVHLLATDGDGELRERARLGGLRPSHAAWFHPDEQRLVVVDTTARVRFWDLNALGQAVRRRSGPLGESLFKVFDFGTKEERAQALARHEERDHPEALIEGARRALDAKDFEMALLQLEELRLVRPRWARCAFERARVFATRGADADRVAALEALQEADRLGWLHMMRARQLLTDPAFESLRASEVYLALAARIRSSD